jgi:ferritin
MISDTMRDALNKQIAMEGYASFYYLSMSSWCDNEGLEGCAQYFQRQSAEEHSHMLRLFHYLSEVDSKAIVPAIPQPPVEFENIEVVFNEVYAHEQKVTHAINQLVELAHRENDFTTRNFLEWYVAEQREEEALVRNILDKIRLIGSGPMSLYYIDKEIETINAAEVKAAAASTEA